MSPVPGVLIRRASLLPVAVALSLFTAAAVAVQPGRAVDAQQPVHTASLRRPDGALSYRIGGAGATVLILSGGPGFSGGYLTGVFEHMAAHAHAILLDQRGTGQSRLTRVDSTTITLAKEVGDIDALRVTLHVNQIVLLGHSWGGQLAMAYAAAHPEHVAGLILVGSGGPSLRSQEIIGEKLAARLTPADRDSIRAWSALASGPRRAEAVREMGRLNRKAYMYDLRNQPAVEREKAASPIDARVSALVFQDLRRTRFDLSAALVGLRKPRRVPIPVLLMYGDADVIGSTTAPEITALLPQADTHVVPHSGHYPWIESASDFYSQLDRFMMQF